ncbi:MAG: DUF2784 domain-containing protein [Gemmataceae bacterium]|nr:DUF2784 domain-containing protein [Gemmataceae bacterium]
MLKLLATALVMIHLGYVAFVLAAQLLILLGLACRWQWTRNLRFRVTHLIMTEIVALEGLFNVRCPLTDWQDRIETLARTTAQPDHAEAVPIVRSGGAGEPPPGPSPATGSPPQQASSTSPPPTPPTPPRDPVPPPAAMPASTPAAPADLEPGQDDPGTTFVGRILNAILYLDVDQDELDRWYVRFGALTLLIFLVYPPRLGTWSVQGFAGMILLWLGTFTALAAWYELKWTTYPRATQAPLEIGIILVLTGTVCALMARAKKTPAQPPPRVQTT